MAGRGPWQLVACAGGKRGAPRERVWCVCTLRCNPASSAGLCDNDPKCGRVPPGTEQVALAAAGPVQRVNWSQPWPVRRPRCVGAGDVRVVRTDTCVGSSVNSVNGKGLWWRWLTLASALSPQPCSDQDVLWLRVRALVQSRPVPRK